MKRRSLVLITVDCLRADRVGFRGYTRPLTPFLESIAETGIVFSEAVVAGAPTYFSFPAIMASRYPLGLGREVLGIAPGEATIASALQQSGYKTAAFVAANPYLSPRFGYDRGFNHFSDFLDFDAVNVQETTVPAQSAGWSELNRSLERVSRSTKITAAAYDELYFRYCQWRSGREERSMDQLRRYPAADVLVGAASDWLKGLGGQPFLLWIHLMDPHHPYYPPPEALQSLGVSDMTANRARFLNSFWNRGDLSAVRLQRHQAEVTTLYDAGIRWVDQQLSRLVDGLKNTQHWSESIFVVTADHGEEFLEHGNRYHSPVGLSEQLIRVPLVIHAPEIPAPRNVSGSFSLIHLAPTLLQGLGIESPSSFEGRAYWNEISAGRLPIEPAIIECVEQCNNPLSVAGRMLPRLMAVRDRDHKLVIRFSAQSEDLYDLKNDPHESRPLPAGVQAQERVRLLRCAGEHLRRSRERRDTVLALRARLREIRQNIELKSLHAGASVDPSAVEIGKHG